VVEIDFTGPELNKIQLESSHLDLVALSLVGDTIPSSHRLPFINVRLVLLQRNSSVFPKFILAAFNLDLYLAVILPGAL
jgi:hypothetical protein